MMKTVKKSVCVVLAMLFAFSLAACGGGSNTDWLNVDVTANRPTLSGLYPNSGQRDSDFKDSITTQLFEKMTGYKVNYYQTAGANAEAEVGNALLEDETYSFIKCARGAFDQYVVQDAFLDITELLQKYGQNLLEVIDDELWDACKYNGKIYAIPEYGFGYMQDNALVFNYEHLTRVGINKVPETLTEFTQAVTKLQAEFGKNDSNYHALAMASSDAELAVLSSAFEMPKEFYEDSDGKVKNYIYSDKTYNYLRYMNKLARGNCLPPNWDSAQSSQLMKWFTNENISVAYLPYWVIASLCDQMSSDKRTKYPTAADAFASIRWQTSIRGDGSDGSVMQEKGKYRIADDIGYFITIPFQSRATAAYAIDWMNTRIVEENYRAFLIGEEGISYSIIPETEATQNDIPITEADGSTRYYRLLDGYKNIINNSMYATGGNPSVGRRYWPLREKNYNCWEILLPVEAEDLCIRSAISKCPILQEWSKISIEARSRVLTYFQRMINAEVDGDASTRGSLDFYLKTVKNQFETTYWTSKCDAQVQEWYSSKSA